MKRSATGTSGNSSGNTNGSRSNENADAIEFCQPPASTRDSPHGIRPIGMQAAWLSRWDLGVLELQWKLPYRTRSASVSLLMYGVLVLYLIFLIFHTLDGQTTSALPTPNKHRQRLASRSGSISIGLWQLNATYLRDVSCHRRATAKASVTTDIRALASRKHRQCY